jgi:hypothetical protein
MSSLYSNTTPAYLLPVITKVTPRDKSIFIQWTYDVDTKFITEEFFVDVYDTITDTLTQQYIPDVSNPSFRITGLINDHLYLIKLGQILGNDNGDEIYSTNAIKVTPRTKPNCTVEILNAIITESPDASFQTIINFRLFDMLYDDAKIRQVNLKLVEETSGKLLTFVIPEATLLKDSEDNFLELQSFHINTLIDGTYITSASLTNAYGTSVLSPNLQFIVQDKPNEVTDLKVLSGLNNAVNVNFKCVESIVTGFHIRQFIVKYFKKSVPNTILEEIITNVDINNVPLYTPAQVINVSVDVLNLDNTEEYVFSVVAVNKRGEGVTSSSVSGWAGLPDKLTNVVVGYVTNTTLSATWAVEAKNYRFKTLKYSILRDNVEIKFGNLTVTDLRLDLSDMALLDGQQVSLKLIPYIDSPLDFDPYDGVKSSDGIYSVNNVVTSAAQIVYAKANILYATSGINHKSIQLVAKVFNSEVTSLVFEAKSTTSSSWNVLGTLPRADLSLNDSQLVGTLNVDNLELGQYDVRAKAMYGANSGPETGLQGKVTSLDLPKMESVSVLQLSEELLQIKVVYDRESVPDHTVVEVYDNSAASGTALASVVLGGAGAIVSNNARARIYTVSNLSLSVHMLVYVKCLIRRTVDTSYYIADQSAPVPVLESITYNSFIDSRSYYVSSQGSVVSLSGENAQNNLVASFPHNGNTDLWSRVKSVVLQRSINNVDWSIVESIVFDPATADIANNVTFNVLDNTSVINAQLYKYRVYNVGKDIENPGLPVFNENKYAVVKPFLASEVTSVNLTANINENDNKLKVNVSWNLSVGTFSTFYDVLLYSQGVLVASATKQSESSTYDFNLSVDDVCNTLGLTYSNLKNAAELLYNRTIYVSVNPFINIQNSNLIDTLSYVPKFTKVDGFLEYSGLNSSSSLPSIVPNTPSDLTLISLSSDNATFNWVKSIIMINRRELIKYTLQLSLSSTFSTIDKTYDIFPESNAALTQSFNATGLNLNTNYYPRIVAVNNLGYSVYVYGNVFKTSDSLPSMGAISVTQNSDDGLPKCDIAFEKITPETYSVINYTLSVFNNTTNVKIEDKTLANNEVMPYVYTGEFKKTYKFKVIANLTNALNEPLQSTVSESQPITICDKPSIQSIVWSSNVTTSVNITVDPKGADTVNLLLLALPVNNSSEVSPVFTPSTPEIGVNGLFYYIIDLPYLVDEPPKFIIVVSNIKGTVFTSDGF